MRQEEGDSWVRRGSRPRANGRQQNSHLTRAPELPENRVPLGQQLARGAPEGSGGCQELDVQHLSTQESQTAFGGFDVLSVCILLMKRIIN